MHDTLWRDLGTQLKGVKGIHHMTSDISHSWRSRFLTSQVKHDRKSCTNDSKYVHHCWYESKCQEGAPKGNQEQYGAYLYFMTQDQYCGFLNNVCLFRNEVHFREMHS